MAGASVEAALRVAVLTALASVASAAPGAAGPPPGAPPGPSPATLAPVKPGMAVFVPGDEAFLKQIFQDGVVPGCRWRGTRIGPREAVTILECDGGVGARVRLAPLEDAAPDDARTPPFAVGFGLTGNPPAGLRETFLARLKERSAAFSWKTTAHSPVTEEAPAAKEGPAGTPGSAPIVPGTEKGGGEEKGVRPAGTAREKPPARDLRQTAAFSAGLLLLGAGLFLLRSAPETAHDPGLTGPWYAPARLAPPLILLAALLAVAPPFTFRLDDFEYLVKALSRSPVPDPGGRFLGVTLPFALGARLGPWFFLGASVGAAAVYAWLLAALARRLGVSDGGARLGASLAVTTLPALLLFSWAAPFQQLAVMAGLAGATLALVRAFEAEPGARRERSGATLLAAGAAVLCVLSKFPVAVLVVPTGALAALALGRLRRALLPLGVAAAAQLLTLLAFSPLASSVEVVRLGPKGVGANLALALSWAAPALAPLAALTLLVALLFRRGPDPDGQGPPFRKSLPLALAASALWLAPFLLNSLYFTSYYLALALGPLCVVLAEEIARRTASVRWPVLGAAIAIALVPFAPALSFRRTVAYDFVDLRPLLAHVAEATHSRSAPAPVALVARCADEAATVRAGAYLASCWKSSERGNAFRWATGWYDAPFRVAAGDAPPLPGEIVVVWCGDGPSAGRP